MYWRKRRGTWGSPWKEAYISLYESRRVPAQCTYMYNDGKRRRGEWSWEGGQSPHMNVAVAFHFFFEIRSEKMCRGYISIISKTYWNTTTIVPVSRLLNIIITILLIISLWLKDELFYFSSSLFVFSLQEWRHMHANWEYLHLQLSAWVHRAKMWND